MSTIICRVCEEEFDEFATFHKGGYRNICGHCKNPRKDVVRTIGMIVATGKTDQFTQIIKNPSKHIQQFVKSQGMAGPSQCNRSLNLGLSIQDRKEINEE